MKKILLGFLAFLLISVVACKKDAFTDADTQATENTYTDADGYEYVDDSNSFDETPEPVELEERATSPFAISAVAITSPSNPGSFDGCGSHKYAGLLIPQESSVTLTGVGFGATKGNSTLEAFGTKDTSNKFTVSIASWSETSIVFSIGGVADTAKNFSMKVRLTNPAVPRDSSASNPAKFVSKTKSKTIKCIGQRSSGALYGSNDWELLAQRIKAGKDASIPSTTTITLGDSLTASNYTPAIGDILENAAGKQGVVVAIGPADTKLRLPLTIWQRNTLCTGTVKKGTWKYLKGAFTKSDLSTWTKFAH